MKRLYKKIIYAIGIAAILLTIALLWCFSTTIGINNISKLQSYIANKDNVENVEIKKTGSDGELFCALYTERTGSMRLIILEQDKIFKDRYRYFGGASGDSSFRTYNFGNPQYALIIVYGDNNRVKASKYSFVNSGKTYTEDIQGMEYVMTIYRIPFRDDISGNFILYDEDGNAISQY